jgi:four helix bundle protein
MEKKYNDFRDMGVWQKSFLLLIDIYSIIKKFPADERLALTDQLKRAANSVVHNLAEGYGRYEPKDKTRFYKIARGSAFESMSQILVAESQNYLSTEISENIIERYKKVIEEINALIHHLEK